MSVAKRRAYDEEFIIGNVEVSDIVSDCDEDEGCDGELILKRNFGVQKFLFGRGSINCLSIVIPCV